MSQVYLICGPTASGKTALALELAVKNGGAIVNADAFQIYKEIPICTASPSSCDQGSVVHYLYNYISALEDYSVGQYVIHATECIEKIVSAGQNAIIVGGTGLYINALLYGIDKIPAIPDTIRDDARALFIEKGKDRFYDILLTLMPDIKSKIKPSDTQRMIRAYEVFTVSNKPIWSFYGTAQGIADTYSIEIIKVLPSREELYIKCNARVHDLIQQGAIEEIKALLPYWHEIKSSPKKAILVSELYQYLTGTMSLDDSISIAQQNTRNYAKRQYTWFRNQL